MTVGGTSDCEVSILNSIEPLNNFPITKIASIEYPNSIAKIFKQNGYSVQAFHNNVKEFYSRGINFSKLGFEKMFDIKEMNLSQKGWGAPDLDMFKFICNHMKFQNNPFFYYIITMSSHPPFKYVKSYYHIDVYNGVKNRIIKNYYISMSYVDSCLKYFIDQISNVNNTYVFIFGDHTPGIKEREYRDSSTIYNNHYLRFVPLIIYSTSSLNKETFNFVASFFDIGITVLDISGINYSFYSLGSSLLCEDVKKTKIKFYDNYFDRFILFKIVDNHNSGFVQNKDLSSRHENKCRTIIFKNVHLKQ
jgi:phosphoglycerol transferase MdoB-like AlkP superfamily enzyme